MSVKNPADLATFLETSKLQIVLAEIFGDAIFPYREIVTQIIHAVVGETERQTSIETREQIILAITLAEAVVLRWRGSRLAASRLGIARHDISRLTPARHEISRLRRSGV